MKEHLPAEITQAELRAYLELVELGNQRDALRLSLAEGPNDRADAELRGHVGAQ